MVNFFCLVGKDLFFAYLLFIKEIKMANASLKYYVYFSAGALRHKYGAMDSNCISLDKIREYAKEHSVDGRVYNTEEEANKACLVADRKYGTWGETEGEGYVIRTSLVPFYDGWGYWSGYKKDPKFEKNFYAAKIYEDSISAQKAINKHAGQEFWDTACIIKVSFRENTCSSSEVKNK